MDDQMSAAQQEREAFEAYMRKLNATTSFARQRAVLGGHYRTTTVQRAWELWQAALASPPPADAERLRKDAEHRERIAFEFGWRTAAGWSEQGYLISDIGSAAYIADRDSALSDIDATIASKDQS